MIKDLSIEIAAANFNWKIFDLGQTSAMTWEVHISRWREIFGATWRHFPSSTTQHHHPPWRLLLLPQSLPPRLQSLLQSVTGSLATLTMMEWHLFTFILLLKLWMTMSTQHNFVDVDCSVSSATLKRKLERAQSYVFPMEVTFRSKRHLTLSANGIMNTPFLLQAENHRKSRLHSTGVKWHERYVRGMCVCVCVSYGNVLTRNRLSHTYCLFFI